MRRNGGGCKKSVDGLLCAGPSEGGLGPFVDKCSEDVEGITACGAKDVNEIIGVRPDDYRLGLEPLCSESSANFSCALRNLVGVESCDDSSDSSELVEASWVSCESKGGEVVVWSAEESKQIY